MKNETPDLGQKKGAHALLFPPVALPVQDPVHVALAFLIFELS
jgi:hypothetical protein